MNHKKEIIEYASPHTIKKFELIEKYVKGWAQKLLNYPKCRGLVFVDCMSNSGEYIDSDGNPVFGTPVRVAHYLRKIADDYPAKQIDVYFSDLDSDKTDHLKSLMPLDSENFHVHITTEDGNNLAKRIGKSMNINKHYFLVYDPYVAKIDWDAIKPFINSWSEIIINHMVSDPIRAIKQVKTKNARDKYEHTYLMHLEEIIEYGSNRQALEERVEEIIKENRNNEYPYYIAAFPFFNS